MLPQELQSLRPAIECAKIRLQHIDRPSAGRQKRRRRFDDVHRRCDARREIGGAPAERQERLLQAVGADRPHTPLAGELREASLLLFRQPLDEQVEIVEPQQVRRIRMVRDPMQAREQQAMRVARAERMRAEAGEGGRVADDLVVGQQVGKGDRIRDPPVHVQRMRDPGAIDELTVELRHDERALRFDRPAIAQGLQHARGILAPRCGHEHVGVAPEAQLRAPVVRPRDRHALEEDDADTRAGERSQNALQFLLAQRFHGHSGAPFVCEFRDRASIRNEQVNAMAPGQRDQVGAHGHASDVRCVHERAQLIGERDGHAHPHYGRTAHRLRAIRAIARVDGEMDSRENIRATVSDLLAQAQMPEADVRRRAELAGDPHYWLGVAAEMAIGHSPHVPSRAVPPDALDAARRRFAAEGYFQTPVVIGPQDLARLNGAIDAVVAAGWPPVFAWVYDEFWALARLPDVADLLASQIGGGYLQIPHIWTHVVPAMVGASGWTPHFDGPVNGRASIWIALTDATLSNGCMHVVARRHLDATFESEPLETGRVAITDAFRALQGVRALPAARGSVLGWTFDVLHWGGVCLAADGARRAISMEFIAVDHSPNRDELPLLPLDAAFPSFSDRLRMIANAVVSYEKFEPGLIRYRAVAKRLRA